MANVVFLNQKNVTLWYRHIIFHISNMENEEKILQKMDTPKLLYCVHLCIVCVCTLNSEMVGRAFEADIRGEPRFLILPY